MIRQLRSSIAAGAVSLIAALAVSWAPNGTVEFILQAFAVGFGFLCLVLFIVEC